MTTTEQINAILAGLKAMAEHPRHPHSGRYMLGFKDGAKPKVRRALEVAVKELEAYRIMRDMKETHALATVLSILNEPEA